MKVVISHDVDHITPWEHKSNLIIPKQTIRSLIELSLGYISISEILHRIKDILRNKWQNLESLLKFDKENSIPSTFFIGVSNGKGLNYTIKDAELWIKKILQEGFDVGGHGIAFNNHDAIKKEYENFRNISGLNKFGIRMHYLRNSDNTLKFLNKSGYLFDTTLYEFKNPFKVGDIWEFPLHIMDGHIINKNTKWQNQNLKQSKETTKRILANSHKADIKYFTVLFHDNYFSNSFKTWKEWYIWLIRYLKDNNIEFINYDGAIKELEASQRQ